MKTFETTVEHDEQNRMTYVYLTNAPALVKRRGAVKRTITFRNDTEATWQRINVDVNQNGEIVGVELDGFVLPQ